MGARHIDPDTVALLDAEVARLRATGAPLSFAWIPEQDEEPDDLDLAELELDEPDEETAAPVETDAGPPLSPNIGASPSTPEERAQAVARIRAMEAAGYGSRYDIIAGLAADLGRSVWTLRRWAQEADRRDGRTVRSVAWTKGDRR